MSSDQSNLRYGLKTVWHTFNIDPDASMRCPSGAHASRVQNRTNFVRALLAPNFKKFPYYRDDLEVSEVVSLI